jgi:hypothetical protein
MVIACGAALIAGPALAGCAARDAIEVALRDTTVCVRTFEDGSGPIHRNDDGDAVGLGWQRRDLFVERGTHDEPKTGGAPDLAATWPPGVLSIGLGTIGLRPRPAGLPRASHSADLLVEDPGPSESFWPVGLSFRGSDHILVSCFEITYLWQTIDDAEDCTISIDLEGYRVGFRTLTQDYTLTGRWPRLRRSYDRTAWQAALDSVDRFLRVAAPIAADE